MQFVDIHHGSARIPCIYLTSRESETGKQVYDIESCGYAILSDIKLVGYLDKDISRGVSLITNDIESSVIVVKDMTDQDVSLEIIRANTKVIPFFNGDNLERVLLKTKVISHLGEIQSLAEYTNENSISYMEIQQSEILKNEMQSALEKILELKADCLDICDRIRLKRPLKWHKIEDQWAEIFPNIKFDIQVESKIRRTYELREPSGYKWKE